MYEYFCLYGSFCVYESFGVYKYFLRYEFCCVYEYFCVYQFFLISESLCILQIESFWLNESSCKYESFCGYGPFLLLRIQFCYLNPFGDMNVLLHTVLVKFFALIESLPQRLFFLLMLIFVELSFVQPLYMIFRSASSSRNRKKKRKKKNKEKVSNSNNLLSHAFTCTLSLDTWYLILETKN